MKRLGLGIGAALMVIGAVGCAGTKPCMIIPAQIELAESVRDAAQADLARQGDQVKRWETALRQSETRLARLIEDRDKLRDEIGGNEEAQK